MESLADRVPQTVGAQSLIATVITYRRNTEVQPTARIRSCGEWYINKLFDGTIVPTSHGVSHQRVLNYDTIPSR